MNNERKLVILARAPFNTKAKQFSIGGVQTYLKNLAEVARDNGYAVTICENNRFDSSEGSMEYEGMTIRYKPYPPKGKDSFYFQNIFEYWYALFNDENTVFVVETDQQSFKSRANNVIQIQHGIAFDIPRDFIGGFWGKSTTLSRIQKLLRCERNVGRLHQVRNTVCVDYNFFNWFRTLDTIREDERVIVIPNFSVGCINQSELDAKIDGWKNRHTVKIVMARRYVEHRGVVMFAKVIKRLLADGANIEVTFAGEGPCENMIKQILNGYDCVRFTSYKAKDSISFHKQFDIAVVPTIFSEGTSLSLSEAMSAGCIPVATCVGGMTNMILDGYNGFLSYPSEDSLYDKLREVLSLTPEVHSKICNNAYQSAVSAFSREVWASRWLKFIDDVMLGK